MATEEHLPKKRPLLSLYPFGVNLMVMIFYIIWIRSDNEPEFITAIFYVIGHTIFCVIKANLVDDALRKKQWLSTGLFIAIIGITSCCILKWSAF